MTSIHKGLNGWIKPGTSAAAVMICGFWAAQMLAWYFFTGSICGIEPKSLGSLALGIFVVFFILHFSRPWSRLAAFLGLCSLAVLSAFMIYVHGSACDAFIPSGPSLMMLSAAMALGGVILDAEKYRQWLAREHHEPLKLKGAPAAGSDDFDMTRYI